MKVKSLVVTVSSLLLAATLLDTAQAELKLPSGSDRRPDLSLDPFERAREALRKLPSSEEKAEQEKEPEREQAPPEPQPQAAEPSIEERRAQHDSLDIVPMEEPGDPFSYEFAATVDALSIASGGNPQPDEEDFEQNTTGIFGVVDLIAEVDTGAAGFWDNGLFFLYTAFTFGAAPAVGDLHGTSGIYAGGNTLRIVEAWYEHSFEHSHSSFLFGWHDFNGEFYVSEYASLFVNAGFGMGQTLAEHGGPSGYPVTTLGVRYKSDLTENSYFQFAMYDGAPTDEAFNKIIEVGLDKNDGVFVGSEAGYLTGEPGEKGYMKIAAGLWYLRATNEGFETQQTDPTTGDPVPLLADNPAPHNTGAYFLAEASIGENLGLFFKHGRARARYNQYGQFYAAGLNYIGIIPGREEDVLGIGMVHTRHSDEFLAEWPNEYFIAETAFEVTYATQILDWLMLQPTVQYIQQPAMSLEIPNTTVIGIQAQAVF